MGLAEFDSTTTFVRAIASHLRGEGFPRMGVIPKPLARLGRTPNRLPDATKRWIYRKSGATEAIPPDQIGDVDVDTFRSWVTETYPERGYPAIMLGAPSGAGAFLAALLGIPYLPQTFLTPVRRKITPGQGKDDMEWGRRPGRALLEANPDVNLHHMHDPNEDWLMVREFAYFRIKLRDLGDAYERFIKETLSPGGSLIIIDCDDPKPVTRINDRHVFQFSGQGGLPPDEFLEGSDRVDAFLAKRPEEDASWDAPEPTDTAPEAEWGFDDVILEDVDSFAHDHGYPQRTLRFQDPRDLSAPVADLHRERYGEHDIPTNRLLVQSFTLIDPWWSQRTGSVPYWAPFNGEDSAETLETYLDQGDPYDEIYLMAFSNGVESAAQASIERWRTILERAQRRGEFLGMDPDAYPLDFGVYTKYHDEIPEKIPARHGLLPPLPVKRLEAFLHENQDAHNLEWANR